MFLFRFFAGFHVTWAAGDEQWREAAKSFGAQLCIELDQRSCQEDILNRTRLTLPDLQTLAPHELRLVVSDGGDRRILRFSNSVANIGPGVLEVAGQYDYGNNRVAVSQNLFKSDGSISVRRIGDFDFHREHNHWHWDEFSIYEIWRVDADGNLVEAVVNSGKVGYCMIDISRSDFDALRAGIQASDRAQYRSCGWTRQGISIGWVDTYDLNTPGQVMDVSNLRDDLYALVSTVDPEGILTEIEDQNNTAGVFFYLRGEEIFYLRSMPAEDLPDTMNH